MRVLVVGSGGREHALCWALAASPLTEALFCAPGNVGIAEEAISVPIAATDLAALVAFARAERIDFVVVGPEAPLVAGLVDRLEEAGIKAFGPSAAAARLEASKAFTKELCAAHGIPTAAFGRFRDAAAARAYARARGAPIVIKADGLAAGKGVTVARTLDEAMAAIDATLVEQRFGAAGAELVIEECLTGTEASFFALCDGASALPLATAQDYKAAFDGNRGPNTGGMGAISPAPALDPAAQERVMAKIIRPTLSAMAAAGCPFRGVLFAGLMVTATGPKLLEYNVRFGDPETQPLMLRLRSDLLPALLAAHDGVLKNFHLRWHERPAVCVVMAGRGYPDTPARGGVIEGLDALGGDPDLKVFHAATKRDGQGRLIADGGRVLGVTALGDDLAAARARAYAAVDRIRWADGFCRRDIGLPPAG